MSSESSTVVIPLAGGGTLYLGISLRLAPTPLRTGFPIEIKLSLIHDPILPASISL